MSFKSADGFKTGHLNCTLFWHGGIFENQKSKIKNQKSKKRNEFIISLFCCAEHYKQTGFK